LLVRFVGLYRDSLMATSIGMTSEADAFYLILTWANVLVSFLGLSAINEFIPIKAKESNEFLTNKKLLAKFKTYILGSTGAFVLFITLGINFYSLDLVFLGACIFLTQMGCQLLSSLLNLKKQFVLPAFLFSLPILAVSVGLLGGISLGSNILKYFLFGSFIQFLILIFAILLSKSRQDNFGFIPALAYYKKCIFSVFSVPMNSLRHTFNSWGQLILATAYFPLAELIINLQADALEAGGVAAIAYACRIPFAIVNLLTYSVWAVLLPGFSVEEKFKEKTYIIKFSFAAISMFLLVAIFGFYISPQIIHLIYGHSSLLNPASLTEIANLQKLFFLILPIQASSILLLKGIHAWGFTPGVLIVSFLGLLVQILIFTLVDFGLWGIPLSLGLNYLTIVFVLSLTWGSKKYRLNS